MDDIKDKNASEVLEDKEYVTEDEGKAFREILLRCIKSYKEKDNFVSDKEWLKALFKEEIPKMTDEEVENSSIEIIESISEFDSNLTLINESIRKGISKEAWLEEKMQESVIGMSISEYGQSLQKLDDILKSTNKQIHNELCRQADGNIKMSRNLDGNIAEHLVAKSTELSGFVQGKNVKVEVRDVFTPNSVDVRAVNMDTGKYQNYQLKFGKNAQATIDLIERGNYNNQRIVVPSEQLDEIQAHFNDKGSNKTITDHIDAWGAKGKKFTKEDVKNLQTKAQQEGLMPTMDYSHYQTKELAMSIGKNAGVMALQTAAITTGLTVAKKVANGEAIDTEEMIDVAIKSGKDTSIKVITAGALQVAIRKGIISIIPKMTRAEVIANIACVGIENIKVLSKIASGELSFTTGLEQMGRITISMIGGLYAMGKGALIGVSLTSWIPVIGPGIGSVTGLVGGMVGYFAGSRIGDRIYEVGKSIAGSVKPIASSAWNGIKSVGSLVKSTGRRVFG